MGLLREHLTVLPIVLPLATGAIMLLIDERRYALKGALASASTLLLIILAMALLRRVDLPSTEIYRLGDWPAPFAIVLVADRLSALMVLLASVLGLAAVLFSLARWQRLAPRFHSILQFLLVGVNGAFLTGDLFNLFVFFEVLLAASYGLALLGSGTARVVNGLHYIAINLTASLLFLIGASLLYGVAGTLNMADLAAHLRMISEADRALFEAGVAILGVAFFVKAAMWPLGLWLPNVYAGAAAPAAAMFAILTKVGVYTVLRVSLLLYGDDPAGDWTASALVVGGAITLIFGTVGALATQDMTRLAGFSLLISAGTLLAAIGTANVTVTAAALYYLVVSTLGVGAFFLLIELIERGRNPAASVLAVTAEAFGIDADAEEEVETGVAIPATMALLGLSFVGCALLLVGLPPLPGFIAKFALFDALLRPNPIPVAAWILFPLLTLSSIAVLIAFARFGVRAFWASAEQDIPRVRVIELAPVVLLLSLCFLLMVLGDSPMRYLRDMAHALHDPQIYIQAVLSP